MDTEEGKETIPETTETPTPEIESLKSQITELSGKLGQSDKGLRTAHQKLTEKDKELKSRVDLETRIEDIGAAQKVLASVLASSMGKSEEEFEETVSKQKPDLLKQFNTLVEAQKKDRESAVYNREADTIWSRALSAGLTEESDEYWVIHDALAKEGNLKKAEAKVSKLENSKTEVNAEPEKKPLSDEEKAEIAREWMEKEGQLKTEIVSPAGAGVGKKPTLEEVKAVTAQEYAEKVKSGVWIM